MKPCDKVLLRQSPEEKLKKQPVWLTRMGFGGAPVGNLYRALTEDEAQATLQAAFNSGIRYFDTAPQYGLGLSEQRIGRALARLGANNITLSTKVGRLLQDCEPKDVTPTGFVDTPQKRAIYDYSYDGIMRSHEASLTRLNIEKIDILLVHDVDSYTHGSIEASDARIRELFDLGGFRALDELRQTGQIKAIGAGVNEWQVCEKLLSLADFDTFLLAGRYTLLEQDALDSFLPLCVKRDVGLIIGGPFNSGILALGAVEGARYNYEKPSADIITRVRHMEAVCASHNVRLIEAAVQFIMGHPAVRTVIPGAMTPAEVETNMSLFDRQIPALLWSDLKSEGLIREDAPTPYSLPEED